MTQRVTHEVLEDTCKGLGIGIHGKRVVLEVHARLPPAPLERGELPHQHIDQRRQHGHGTQVEREVGVVSLRVGEQLVKERAHVVEPRLGGG